MLFTVAANERAALQLDDLASALDAGMTVEALDGDPTNAERAVHGMLAQRGVALTATEDAVLAAAWNAGRIGAALRGRAEQRRQRAELGRHLRSALRYPAVLLVMAVAISVIMTQIFGYGLLITVSGGVAAIVAAVWFVQRGIRTGGEHWLELPWIGPLAAAFAELPYLETLHALYASGIPIVEAHAQATGTVRVASLRLRLRDAERTLREGGTLTDGLMRSGALLEESRTLLASGEAAGQLEDAVQRTLTRRRDVAARDARTTARWATGIVYGCAILVAVYVILSFYLDYFGRLTRY